MLSFPGPIHRVLFSPAGDRLGVLVDGAGPRCSDALLEGTSGDVSCRSASTGDRSWCNERRLIPAGTSQDACLGGDDHSIIFWDLATGQELITLKGHAGWVNSVAFSPDGTMLASGSHDGYVRIWHAPRKEDTSLSLGSQSQAKPLAREEPGFVGLMRPSSLSR